MSNFWSTCLVRTPGFAETLRSADDCTRVQNVHTTTYARTSPPFPRLPLLPGLRVINIIFSRVFRMCACSCVCSLGTPIDSHVTDRPSKLCCDQGPLWNIKYECRGSLHTRRAIDTLLYTPLVPGLTSL